MDTAQSDPIPVDPTPTPEPVRWFSRVTAALTLLLTQINPAADYFGWWHLDATGLNFAIQIIGAFAAAAILMGGAQVRDQVMPMKKVSRIVAAAKAEVPPGLDPAYVDPADAAFVADRAAKRAAVDQEALRRLAQQ